MGTSLSKALSPAWVQGVYISIEDDLPLPLVGFSLKGAIITSDFMSSFTGEEEAAGGGGDWRKKEIAYGLGSLDK